MTFWRSIELSTTAGLVSLTADAFGRVPKLSCRALQGEAHLSRIGRHPPKQALKRKAPREANNEAMTAPRVVWKGLESHYRQPALARYPRDFSFWKEPLPDSVSVADSGILKRQPTPLKAFAHSGCGRDAYIASTRKPTKGRPCICPEATTILRRPQS